MPACVYHGGLMNQLYYGDCLKIMESMGKDSVDMIYLDPPFNSNRAYNAIYKDETGRPLPEQIEAFCDLWTLDEESERSIRQVPKFMIREGIDGSVVKFWQNWMNALRYTNPKLLAYLSYMTERLLQMKIVLRPTGSIFLHCDPTASHYIKVIMDGIFGHQNFRNEIIWKRTNAHNDGNQYGRIHDTILFYSKSNSTVWNPVYMAHDPDYVKKFYRHEDERGCYRVGDLHAPGVTQKGESGQSWRSVNPSAVGRHWSAPRRAAWPKGVEPPENYDSLSVHAKLDVLDANGLIHWPSRGNVPGFKRYLSTSKGARVQDVITDINPLTSRADEGLGYPTQKPLALLRRIIEGSSNEGDVVLDPFCGCGTTLEAAEKLNRRWIGIDIAIHAIKRVSAVRLNERCGLIEGQDYKITGVPQNIEGAKDLWERDKYQFQKWAVEMVDGFVTAQRSNDGGVDGRLYFPVEEESDLKAMKLEVKGGTTVKIESLRALAGVIDEEDYPMGGFITRKTLGRVQKQNFLDFCRTKREIEIGGVSYPRLQILSVEEILEGKRFETPLVRGKAASDQLRFDLSAE